MVLRSPYRFPYNFTRDYLRPSHYWHAAKHWYQRAARGYSDKDTWSLDYHLAEVLIDALPKYKNGSPHHCCLMFTSADQGKAMAPPWDEQLTKDEQAAALERWNLMIDEIVDGFRVVYANDDVAESMSDEASQRLERSLALFSEHFRYFWT